MSKLQRNVLRDREQEHREHRAALERAVTGAFPAIHAKPDTDALPDPPVESDPEDSAPVPVLPSAIDLDTIRTLIRDTVTDVLRTNQSGHTTAGTVPETPYDTYASVMAKPALSLTTEEMVEIRNILNGTFISTSRELISALHRMSKIRLVSNDDGAEFCTVSLPEDVLTRIYSRMPPDTTIEEFVSEKITDWTGMFVDGGL